MTPQIRPRRPASIGSNQASPANSACSAGPLLLSLSMAWSPPARQRRFWLAAQAGDYVTQISYHTRDGTARQCQPDPSELAKLESRCVLGGLWLVHWAETAEHMLCRNHISGLAVVSDLITICIPTYRRPSLLLSCLQTCFMQDYRPLEIDIGDNSPNDQT